MGFIKTIGDAVMFVSTDAAALLRAALELLAAAEKEDMPPLRVGLAAGSAVRRAGDWFGSPVNLASRVTAVSRPGAVLIAEAARDLIGDSDDFTWFFAGARHVKGIKGEVKLFRARTASRNSTLTLAADADFEALGLLDGLEGEARQERVDLISWLLDRVFDMDHIRGSVGAPFNLPGNGLWGQRRVCIRPRDIQTTGIDLEFLQRIHCAVGLPRIDDPDAPNLCASTARPLPRQG